MSKVSHIRAELRDNKKERVKAMKKLEGNRKDWIKNILIIFLVVLLLLTFFSNTIMNYSLAEVSSTYITSGSISTAIRGTGTIQSVDPYNVTISEGRKVESVNVRRGDTVTKGDVLFVLEAGESTEVTDAKKAYQDLLASYDDAIIKGNISSDIITAAQNRDNDVIVQKMSRLEQLGETLRQKKAVVDDIKAQIEVVNAGSAIVDVSSEKAQLEAVNTALSAEKDKLSKFTELQTKIDSLLASASAETDEGKKWDYINQAVTATNDRDALGTQAEIEANIKSYEKQAETINKTIEDKQAAPTEEAKQLNYKLTLANNEYTEAQENYDKLSSEIENQRSLQNLLDQIDEAKNKYETLETKAIGTEVTAPVSGTITAVNVVAGEKVDKDATMATIQLSGKDYTLEMTVTKEQAARIKVGDIGQASNSWYYSDMTLTVSAIKNDTTNPSSGNRIVVFTVTGSDINVGQSVTVSVGDKSASYDMIVPNTAIREDKNGTYILVITSKSTPLGNRYTATRVDVTKLASDDTNTAISCGLQGYESVITTATKPVSAGDLVRLPK